MVLSYLDLAYATTRQANRCCVSCAITRTNGAVEIVCYGIVDGTRHSKEVC